MRDGDVSKIRAYPMNSDKAFVWAFDSTQRDYGEYPLDMIADNYPSDGERAFIFFHQDCFQPLAYIVFADDEHEAYEIFIDAPVHGEPYDDYQTEEDFQNLMDTGVCEINSDGDLIYIEDIVMKEVEVITITYGDAR